MQATNKALLTSLVSTILLFGSGATAQETHATSAQENVSGVPVPVLPQMATEDPKIYGSRIAEHLDIHDQGWTDEVSQGTMTLYDAGGDSVVRSFTRMTIERPEAGDKIITRFLSPAEIKGVSALTHESPGSTDDNWLYLPANKRVRRISGANNTASFQGTEFTYEDLANLDPREYRWRFLEETQIDKEGASLPVYRLDAVPTYKDTGYSKLVVYIHREAWRQERIEYYDKAGQLLKTRESADWRQLHGRFWRSFHLEMVNHQTGKKTVLEQNKVFLNLSLYTSSRTGKARKNLSEDLFTTRSLGS